MEKVTFREFFTTVGRGVWQAMKWVAGMFGYGDPSWYGRLVRRIFAGCLAIIAMVVALAAVCADYAVFSYEYNGTQTKTITNFVYYGFFKHRTRKIQYLLVKNLSSSGTLNISPGTGYFCNFETVTLKAKEGVELSIFKDVVLASSVINF